MKEALFRGTATALITPFTDDGIDYSALDRLLQMQMEAKVPALVITGTTGESATLTPDEKIALWRYCVYPVGSACEVIAGIGSNSTEVSISMAKLAAACGVDSLLAVTPYYNKCTQEGLVAHYTAIADATSLPLILYNVPSRTGVNLMPDTCARLATHPHIHGIKEAGGNLSQVAQILSACNTHLWSGNDDQTVPILSLGGDGVISVLSNLCPKAVVKMTEAALRGDYKTAAALQLHYLPLIDALFCEVNPIPIKFALQHLGLCENILRLPLTPLSKAGEAKVLAAMEHCLS